MTNTECVLCNGPVELLGKLGRLEHYRCRNCGHDQEHEPSCPTCEGPVGPAGRSFMYDRPCEDPCHAGLDEDTGVSSEDHAVP